MSRPNPQVSFAKFGDPSVLQLVNLPIHDPGPGELLIEVQAIGVNYSDLLRRRNSYFMPTNLPHVLGTEAVGTIISVGEGVGAPYELGLRVLAILPGGGGYAHFATAPAAYCVPLPSQIEADAATAIFVQGSTAQLMVSHVARPLAGQKVLINAAAGGVGSLLVQLAKQAGAFVIAACGTEKKAAFAKTLGADEALTYNTPGWAEALGAMTGGHGIDVAFEMVGGEVYNETINSLADGGQLVIYGCASGVQGQVDPETFVDRNLSQSGFNLAFYLQRRPQLWQDALGAVIAQLAAGTLRVTTVHRLPLAGAARAHQLLESRQAHGKVVLFPG